MHIMASGHSGRIVTEASLQAKTGRIHDRTRTLRSTVRFLLHRGHTSIHDPDVWSGRALQESSSSWRWAVLHQCIRPLIGACRAPGHHGYQRACDLISG